MGKEMSQEAAAIRLQSVQQQGAVPLMSGSPIDTLSVSDSSFYVHHRLEMKLYFD